MNLGQLGIFLSTANKQASKSLTHKPSNIITIHIKVLEGINANEIMGCVIGVIGHAVAHAFGDVDDDMPVFLIDFGEFADYHVEFYE